MNNPVLFEVAKYICAPTGIRKVDDAASSKEHVERSRAHIRDLLAKRIGCRPSMAELESRNIIRKEELSFKRIHEILSGINFRQDRPGKIAPSIAGRVNKLNFALKKKMLVQKLGLSEIEYFLRKKR